MSSSAQHKAVSMDSKVESGWDALALFPTSTGVVDARRALGGGVFSEIRPHASSPPASLRAVSSSSRSMQQISVSVTALPISAAELPALSVLSSSSSSYDRSTRLLGVGFGLLSAATVAVAYLAIRRIGHCESAVTMALWFSICSFAVAVASLGLGWPLPPVLPSAADLVLLVVAGLAAYGAQLCLGRSLQLLPASLGSAMTFLTAVELAFAGVLLYNEDLSLGTVLGGLATLVGMYLVALGRADVASARGLPHGHESSASIANATDDDANGEERAPLRSRAAGTHKRGDTELAAV